MTPHDIIRELYDLFADPGRFTSRTLARRANGDWTLPDDPLAVRWCAVGAIEKISGQFFDRGEHPLIVADVAHILGLTHDELVAINNGPDGREAVRALCLQAMIKAAQPELVGA